MAGLDLAKVVRCTTPYEWTAGAWALGDGYRAAAAPRFHVVAYDFGIKHNILRLLAERGCRITVVPAQTPAARRARARSPTAFSCRTAPATRSRAPTRSRRSATLVDARRADLRHLPRPSTAGARVGRTHVQDEVRPPRREPSGARPRHGPGGDHEPEPRLRRRRRPRCPRTCASRTFRCSTAACRASRAPTGRRSASRGIRKRAPARTTSAICSIASSR